MTTSIPAVVTFSDPHWHSLSICILDGKIAEDIAGEACRILVMSWRECEASEKSECYFLFHSHEGELAASSAAGETPSRTAISNARNEKPYGYWDIDVHSKSGAARKMIPKDTSEATITIAKRHISAAIRNFLQDIPDIAAPIVANRLTLLERKFLLGRPWRLQAINAYPWLRPILVAATSSEQNQDLARFNAITEAIDAGKKLAPILQRTLGAHRHVLKTLNAMPPWHPRSFRELLNSDCRPDVIACYLMKIAPEKHPDASDWPKFLLIIRWVRMVWERHGNGLKSEEEKNKVVLPFLTSIIWRAQQQRPRELPGISSLNWLTLLRNSILGAHPLRGSILRGNIGHFNVIMPAETWAVLQALMVHPSDLAAEGRRWSRRSAPAVRHSLLSEFGKHSLPLVIDHAEALSNGYLLQPVRTAAELIRQSGNAQNCLAYYLPDILHCRSVVFAIKTRQGELAGHAEIFQDDDGYRTRECRAIRNQVLGKRLDKAVGIGLDQIILLLNSRGFLSRHKNNILLAEQIRNSIHRIEEDIHVDDANKLMNKAFISFGFVHDSSETNLVSEIEHAIKIERPWLAYELVERRPPPPSALCSEVSLSIGRVETRVWPYEILLPTADDMPDLLVEHFRSFFHSRLHEDVGSAFIRAWLGSFSLNFKESWRIINNAAAFSRSQIDQLLLVFIGEGHEFATLVEKEVLSLLKLSAAMIIKTLLMYRWYGHAPHISESYLIRAILDGAVIRGLRSYLDDISLIEWQNCSLAAYVFRHVLPISHPAWEIGERCNSRIGKSREKVQDTGITCVHVQQSVTDKVR